MEKNVEFEIIIKVGYKNPDLKRQVSVDFNLLPEHKDNLPFKTTLPEKLSNLLKEELNN